MRALNTLPAAELMPVILKNETLCKMFDDYIQDSEQIYLEDKLSCFNWSGVDYSIGFYNPNYFTMKDAADFLNGVYKSIRSFGSTQNLERLYNLCEKLSGTNLFEYHCRKLCALYYHEEIEPSIKFVEDLSYKLYCRQYSPEMDDFIECFADRLDNIYINDDGNIEKYTRLN